ncbi:hypothetical protein [Kitasatospora terrestris]|uniref:Uncharacterized protein n=1 Tax=Kitasatospora terrestris TaxID=258051 RepID=A0ABP9EJ01_9ACTN
MIGAGVEWTEACERCGAAMRCEGGQALVRDRLEWGIEYRCACGAATMVCGDGFGEEPPGLRARLLAEGGRGRLLLAGGSRVAALAEVRTLFGLGLGAAGAALTALVAGTYGATVPEVALLARRLRGRGVEAEVEAVDGAG